MSYFLVIFKFLCGNKYILHRNVVFLVEIKHSLWKLIFCAENYSTWMKFSSRKEKSFGNEILVKSLRASVENILVKFIVTSMHQTHRYSPVTLSRKSYNAPVSYPTMHHFVAELCIVGYLFNSLRPRRNRHHFADNIFKCIFLNENVWILLKSSLKFAPRGPIIDYPALVQIMAWRRPGHKPLSEPMMVRLLMHICITKPQWVNALWDLIDMSNCSPCG